MTAHSDLRAKATAATPGPWTFWHGDDDYYMNCYGVTSESCQHGMVDDEGHAQHTIALTLLQQPRYASLGYPIGDTLARGEWDDNAAYIAAASPDVVLALLDEIDRLQALVEASDVG